MTAPLIVVVGPTASGKSALAESLAGHWPVELISMDSAQIYRGMDIGTAKPDAETRERIPYHLLDIRDPAERYSAAEFARDAKQAIDEIHARGHLPVLVGGTFLYLRALLEGLHDMPPADAQIREAIERDAAALGWPALHARLADVDPASAAKIHPNDAQRIQRALEVATLSGLSRSAAWAAPREPVWTGAVLKLATVPLDRQVLREQIALRFAQMMAQGFLEEVRSLRARGDLDLSLPSMRSVGYRQLWQHLDGDLSLSEAVEQGITATRQYAKRQLTWLRSDADLSVLSENVEVRCEQARNLVAQYLQQTSA